MARNRNSDFKGRRVTSPANANRRLPTLSPSRQWDLEDYLISVEDRRTSHPDGPARAPRSTRSTHVNYAIASHPSRSSNPWDVPTGVAFEDPSRVLICVRRKQRKEVLHALGKAGKVGQRRPRRNHYSEIHC